MYEIDVFSLTLTALAIEFLYLSIRVVRCRLRARVALKDGGDEVLMRAIRAHGNFTEYVSFVLIALLVLAHYRINIVFYSVLCFLLVFARVIHAYGITVMEAAAKPSLRGRQIGASLTYLVLIMALLSILMKILLA